MQTIQWSDFEKVKIVAGTIIAAELLVEAKKPAYALKIDLGSFGIKRSSAQITSLYKTEELVGKQVICVVNFPVKKIGSFESEVLTTGLYRDNGDVVLAVPDKEVPNGAQLG